MNDFTKKQIKNLRKKGISIYGKQWMPGKDGSFANGHTGYLVDDNGTGRVFTFSQVMNLAKEV